MKADNSPEFEEVFISYECGQTEMLTATLPGVQSPRGGNSNFLLVDLRAGADQVYPASPDSHLGPQAEDSDRLGPEEVRLLRGEMRISLTENQVRSFQFSGTLNLAHVFPNRCNLSLKL